MGSRSDLLVSARWMRMAADSQTLISSPLRVSTMAGNLALGLMACGSVNVSFLQTGQVASPERALCMECKLQVQYKQPLLIIIRCHCLVKTGNKVSVLMAH